MDRLKPGAIFPVTSWEGETINVRALTVSEALQVRELLQTIAEQEKQTGIEAVDAFETIGKLCDLVAADPAEAKKSLTCRVAYGVAIRCLNEAHVEAEEKKS